MTKAILGNAEREMGDEARRDSGADTGMKAAVRLGDVRTDREAFPDAREGRGEGEWVERARAHHLQ